MQTTELKTNERKELFLDLCPAPFMRVTFTYNFYHFKLVRAYNLSEDIIFSEMHEALKDLIYLLDTDANNILNKHKLV